MNKNELDYLQDCKKELSDLKKRISDLEERIASLQANMPSDVPAEADEVDFTGIEIGVSIPEPTPAPMPEPKPEFVPEPVPEPMPVEDPPIVAKEEDDTADLPWRKDIPGIRVKNIRSGISLLDRAQFIGTLFKEDFALYDNTVAALNDMASLDQAVAYIKENFPQWNLGSDVVYRFMMAIRKKLG